VLGLTPRFPSLGAGGGYESYYVRAVDPRRPRGIWLRHTVHCAPGEAPVGSVWVTAFGVGDDGGPLAHKASSCSPAVEGGKLRIGDSAFGPDGVEGAAGPAEWELSWSGGQAPLRHLPAEWLYRAPLPKTKLESPRPAVSVRGRVTVGTTTVELDGWPGMVGHNWGTQHAERWIWLHGVAFEDRPHDWLDLALGRVRVGPATTPWVVNGVISLDGERIRVGGLAARPRVDEGPLHLDLRLVGRAARLRLTAHSPSEQTVVWRYADPDGSEHHVANCSVAELEAVVQRRGEPPITLRTAHGATFELGMRERPDNLHIQPFTDP
jgi:hypothetical protein